MIFCNCVLPQMTGRLCARCEAAMCQQAEWTRQPVVIKMARTTYIPHEPLPASPDPASQPEDV
jgi:hypothetical protein